MRKFSYYIGKDGENMTAQYLKHRLYKILDKNYKAAGGEIDIIAQKGNTLVFVEVKYRKDLENGYPREAVTPYKQERIRKTALFYLAKNNIKNMDIRFDVIEILDKHIEHIKNAF